MAAATKFVASAVFGGLAVLGTPALSNAQAGARSPVPPMSRPASFAPGAMAGVVLDEQGNVVSGATISALGATTTVAVTDKDGRFEFGTLAPGPYQVRVHLSGYVTPRARTVQVVPSVRSSSTFSIRKADGVPVLAAGIGVVDVDALPTSADDTPVVGDTSASGDDHGETAWRIRHARRGILKDITIPVELLADDGNQVSSDGWGAFAVVDVLGRSIPSQAKVASDFITQTPFFGQLNLLTASSFNSPEQLFSADTLARNVAFGRVGAPAGSQADWTVSGAVTEADITSWVVSGAYTTRAPARNRYDLGLSYATQRYDGGNLLALRDVADGSRNAGIAYAYDTFSISPAMAVTFGTSFARYDYLADRSLVSPRAELTMTPSTGLRISAAVARRSLAPGAEEFLAPGEAGIWMTPQRTFSSIEGNQPFEAERTAHAELALERDFGSTTVSLRAFRQQTDSQLVTLFGSNLSGEPAATLGHYLVGNTGESRADGCSAGIRGTIGGRLHGSLEYSMIKGDLEPGGNVRYLMLLAPSVVRPQSDRIHDLSSSLEAELPETSTRILVFYRVSNGFAHPNSGDSPAHSAVDGRFDIQVRQSLPFMNFSSARWEMLLALRNSFRESATDQSVYDELLVVRPPKRVVGGVSLRF